jgi:hypothetical protein
MTKTPQHTVRFTHSQLDILETKPIHNLALCLPVGSQQNLYLHRFKKRISYHFFKNV